MNITTLFSATFLVLISFNSYGQDTTNSKSYNYLFFLNNKFTEDMLLESKHLGYGKSQYFEIIVEFTNAGFKGLSEERPAKTDITLYARKISHQIDNLLRVNIKAVHITVVGISKGGYIAQMTSTLLANPKVNFVFIGSYRNQDLVNLP